MKQTLRSPFAGKPRTWQTSDRGGNPAFHVEPRILTPMRAMAVSFLTKLGTIAGIGYALLNVANADHPDAGMLAAAIIIPVIGGIVLHQTLDSFFRKRVRLMLTEQRFSVRGFFGWKHYDRQLPHRFALLPHDWLQAEQAANEYQMQQAQLAHKPYQKQRWYAESFHVSFDYLGQRNDIMTVYGQKEAVAIATRLKACDDVLDAFARRGQGTPLRPADEWGDQPGAIPETV
ncbi:MAG: hypothetical protein WBX11_04900 [Thiobacillaceae bacterium]